MDKPTVYCQISFLQKFLLSLQNSLDIILLDEKSDLNHTAACYKLIFGSSKIIVDVSPETLLNNPHPLIKKLIKNPTNVILCMPDLSSQLKEDSFWQNSSNELFMLDETKDEAEKLATDYGMLILTMDNLPSMGRLLVAHPPVFAKQNDAAFNWSQLAFAKHHFHSAILIDNYFQADDNELNLNIIPLLKELIHNLPAKRPLNFTVITAADRIENVHKKLSGHLKVFGKSINLTVVKTQTLKNHDRHFITNQIWITTGFGFNLLSYNRAKAKSLPQRDTTFIVMPRVSNERVHNTSELTMHQQNTYFTSANHLLAQFKNIILNSEQDRGTEKWHIGELNPIQI